MLPIEFEINPSIYRQMAKYIFLTSNAQFGKNLKQEDHILSRLNDFVQRTREEGLLKEYNQSMRKGDLHPDLFLDGKTNYSDHYLRYHFTGKHARFEKQLYLDVITQLHYKSGNKFQKYLIKMIHELDDEQIQTEKISNLT